MNFSKSVMQDIACDDAPEGFEIILDEIVETDRWSILSKIIFKHEGKFYLSHYSRGATEYQDEGPYENEGDEIGVTEVEPYEKTIISYRKKENK